MFDSQNPKHYQKLRASVGATSRAEHMLLTRQFDEAEKWARRAVELWEEIYPETNRGALETKALRELLQTLANCCQTNGKVDEAAELQRRIASLRNC